MSNPRDILKSAQLRKQKALSEYDSKRLLSSYDIPVVNESIAGDWQKAKEIASHIGYPVVLKLCSPEITHKTEKKLIELNLRDEIELREAFQRLHEQAVAFNGDILVQEMINEVRELAIGMIRDPQFGPTVMFGLGGIFAEVLDDVSFRVAPIEMHDAMEMIKEIRAYKILNAIRGMDAVDIKVLGKSLIALGNIGLEHEDIQEIDVNPMIIKGDKPVAVDALIILKEM